MKPLPNSVQKLKPIADKYFSLYARAYYSKDGVCECYTCGKKFPIKEIDCGHYVSRTCGNLRYDIRNVRPQCKWCNRFCEGKKDEFSLRLEAETPGILKDLNKWKYIIVPFKVADLLEIIKENKEKLKTIDKV
jgi:hypothetical protein